MLALRRMATSSAYCGKYRQYSGHRWKCAREGALKTDRNSVGFTMYQHEICSFIAPPKEILTTDVKAIDLSSWGQHLTYNIYSVDRNIKFTREDVSNNSLPFLDCATHIEENRERKKQMMFTDFTTCSSYNKPFFLSKLSMVVTPMDCGIFVKQLSEFASISGSQPMA
ncbi:hypothetical protein F2P81_010258 [Scophthalmus maximus]|uniref:Uncharacterized protein n=1 Tax=Scophthalmus maximus TaxID=52904 RepID=A0A6A4T2E3_SCOMX|nr:hypothetical protein F2P81_010258 [Scophthalmus maximus]